MDYRIIESPSEAFFVKQKNTTIAAFHKKEHAEMFIELLHEKEKETHTQPKRPPKG